MGMDSPELLLLVENCPRGAETLVTRIIHILTDKGINTVAHSWYLPSTYALKAFAELYLELLVNINL